MIRVCVAGATGWVGRALVPALEAAEDLELVGAVARSAAGAALGGAIPGYGGDVTVSATVDEALERAPADVLIEYTAPEAAREHALAALRGGTHVVIGTSGLDDEDFELIDACARDNGVGALAAGNFAITAVLLQRFAEMAARHLPAWEIIDYSGAGKPDAPSGTARELARRMARAATPEIEIPIAETQGYPEARGLTFHGVQVHSVRVPGFVLAVEAVFGRENERLLLRCEGGSGAEPYVAGTLLATRKVGTLEGLVHGLDGLLDAEDGAA